MRVYYTSTNSTHWLGKLIWGKGVFLNILIAGYSYLIISTSNILSPRFSTNPYQQIIFIAIILLLFIAVAMFYVLRMISLSCDDQYVYVDCLFFTSKIAIADIELISCSTGISAMHHFRIKASGKWRHYFVLSITGIAVSIGLNDFCDYMKKISQGRIEVRSSLPR